MTAPRRILPGSIYFITRRCTQRQFLLRPDPTTTAIIEYCLAEAANRHGIELIAWMQMSNHYHAVVYDPHGRLPAFLEQFHKMVARALNARWGRWENLWSTEQTCVVLLSTPEDVFAKVIYVLTNPINDDLVERVSDWPGASSFEFLGGKALKKIPRPKNFFSDDGVMPAEATLRMQVTQAARGRQSLEEWIASVRKEVHRNEEARRAPGIANKRRVLGRKAVLRVSPFDAPASRDEPRRGLRPERAGKDRRVLIEELAELVAFRKAHRKARLRFKAGKRRVEFPAGTYRMRLLGARCVPFPNAA